MFEIRYVTENDRAFWFTLDEQLRESEFPLKIRDRRGYVIGDSGKLVGIMRYNLMWDILPFLTLIHLEAACRGKGFGRRAMLHWEDEMREGGHKMLMTSTQVNEQAQHFYRKLGYIERGGLFLDNTPIEQPQEMLLIKIL